ncbi:hypothetical protein BDF20DRAFT_988356 [Mycotypha africana]|uniref:uncharacterized protein n=1 Tax=Mycotypha africana TaxID=64632 RepID=UPI0023018B71|nr:uncharacterized protein BDF20DRAFT_988356 [Mycotypha africana]KAI8977387.1 hypothetical protein BDF20DRAFT_988356 [Mycotypha africana]
MNLKNRNRDVRAPTITASKACILHFQEHYYGIMCYLDITSLFVLHGDHLQQHAVDPPTIILVQNVVLRLNAHILTLHAYIVNLITMTKSWKKAVEKGRGKEENMEVAGIDMIFLDIPDTSGVAEPEIFYPTFRSLLRHSYHECLSLLCPLDLS